MTRLERYIAALPRGLDSYETYLQKAAVLHTMLSEERGIASVPLPPALDALVKNPPPVNAWLPEVHCVALAMAAGELHNFDEAAFADFVYARNKRLLKGPLYSVMMLVASPSLILRNLDRRWAMFHRGIRLTVAPPHDNTTQVVMSYPTQLMPEYMAHGYAGVFRAALELSRGKNPRVTLVDWSTARAVYDGVWE